ncbi:hypothetical protein QR685DRAFT_80822 [Neurospora intermedia]|uniref:Secreted protein n=1 Tax=Neurospora intermedia TaxID=5142 RepID=A0ABR3D4I7_NEUIN
MSLALGYVLGFLDVYILALEDIVHCSWVRHKGACLYTDQVHVNQLRAKYILVGTSRQNRGVPAFTALDTRSSRSASRKTPTDIQK